MTAATFTACVVMYLSIRRCYRDFGRERHCLIFFVFRYIFIHSLGISQ